MTVMVLIGCFRARRQLQKDLDDVERAEKVQCELLVVLSFC